MIFTMCQMWKHNVQIMWYTYLFRGQLHFCERSEQKWSWPTCSISTGPGLWQRENHHLHMIEKWALNRGKGVCPYVRTFCVRVSESNTEVRESEIIIRGQLHFCKRSDQKGANFFFSSFKTRENIFLRQNFSRSAPPLRAKRAKVELTDMYYSFVPWIVAKGKFICIWLEKEP